MSQAAGQPGVEVYLVVEVEGCMSDGGVDGVLVKDGGEVGGVHGGVVGPDQVNQQRGQQLSTHILPT